MLKSGYHKSSHFWLEFCAGLCFIAFIDWQIYVKKMSSCAKWYWPLGECKVYRKKRSKVF